MEWILILMIHAGIMSEHDSMGITNIPGFKTEQECNTAGQKSIVLGKGTTKDVKFTCVQRTK
jgi:hypothetical protein